MSEKEIIASLTVMGGESKEDEATRSFFLKMKEKMDRGISLEEAFKEAYEEI